jgi:hypothetical protein
MKRITTFLYNLLNALLGKHYTILRYKTTYNEDGLATFHIPGFLNDPLFNKSYQLGKQTGAWPSIDIQWRVHTCCWAAERAKTLKGDFVECGVFKGGISRAVINYIDFGNLDKKFYLLDTFEGIPLEYVSDAELKLIDPEKRNELYTDTYGQVKETFKLFKNVLLIKGKIPETLPEVESDSIAYLSIDLNNYQPEIAAIRFYWDRLVPGAVVILDDYCYSDKYINQRLEWDKFAKEKGFQILSLPTGQGLIIK